MSGKENRVRVIRRTVTVLVAMAVSAAAANLASAATLTPIPVKTAPPPSNEATASADGAWLSWAQSKSPEKPFRFNLYAQQGAGPRIRVNPAGTRASGGGIDGRTLVYEQWRLGRGSDIYRFNLRTQRRQAFPATVNSRSAESFPSLSARWLLFTRSTPKRDQVLLYNRATGGLRVLASRPNESQSASLRAGQVNGRWAVWEYSRGSESWVFRYHIPMRSTHMLPQPPGSTQFSPGVSSDGTAYYTRVVGDRPGAVIVKRPLGQKARVVARLDDWSFDLYVQDRANGARVVFYTLAYTFGAQDTLDIYKLVNPPPSSP